MKKGFVFDLDGVITDTADFHFQAWQDLADKLDIPLNEEVNERMKGVSRVECMDIILEHGNRENDFTAEEKIALADEKNDLYISLLSNLSQDDLMPGVKDFLDAAQQREIPCSIASASRNAPMILEKLGILDYFVHIVDPTTLTKGKPDPEIFVKAARSLGMEPEDTVGFEDAQSGIHGLKGAGIFAVGISSTTELEGSDIQVNTMEELDIDHLLKQ